jgi:hypothetical protein
MMSRHGDYIMFAKRFPRFRAEDPDRKLEELLARARDPDQGALGLDSPFPHR